MNPRYKLFAPLVALTLGGCKTPAMEADLPAREPGVPEAIQFGVAYSVRPMRINAPSTSIGVDAILDDVAGNAIEPSATQEEGVEITVQLDDGGLVSVIQADASLIVPGERVELLSSGGVDRVVPIPEAPNAPAGRISPGH
jgi:outer membrane lipoprotein SlyB